jgi:hypothetical protein
MTGKMATWKSAQLKVPSRTRCHGAKMLVRQATMLAFVDNFRILGMASLAVIPLVFLIKKVQPGQRAGMGH